MLVFPSLVFIIFKDFVCLYLLHFAWQSYLRDYEDYAVCDFLEFGWPVGFDYSSSFPKTPDFRHHKGAIDFPDAVDSYLLSETVRNAVTGPFSHNPFSCPVAVSPLNSVPKSDTTERRIILDLSWPVGSSVNDGIQSGSYLAREIALVYPTVDLIADRVAALGSGCLLFKQDLKRAYRQFPVDPRDYPLLGYFWNGNFISTLSCPWDSELLPWLASVQQMLFVTFFLLPVVMFLIT